MAADCKGQLVWMTMIAVPLIKLLTCWIVCRVSLLFGKTLYLIASGYYTVICFLGYNGD